MRLSESDFGTEPVRSKDDDDDDDDEVNVEEDDEEEVEEDEDEELEEPVEDEENAEGRGGASTVLRRWGSPNTLRALPSTAAGIPSSNPCETEEGVGGDDKEAKAVYFFS